MKKPLACVLGLLATWPLALVAASPAGPSPAPSSAPAPMVFYWRATIHADMADRASSLITRMQGYVTNNYPDMRLRVLTNDLSQNDTVHWFMEHEDIASRRQWQRDLRGDEGWQPLEGEAEECFRPDTQLYTYLFHVAGPPLDDRSKPVRQLTITRTPAMKVVPARSFATRVVDYLEQHYPGLDARVYSSEVHDSQALYWMVDYENTSTWESTRAALLADEGYQELMGDAGDLFLEDLRSDILVDY